MDSATVTRPGLHLLLIAALLAASPSARAEPPSESLRRVVIALLTSPRGFPERKHFYRIGPAADTNRALADIVIDRHMAPEIRLNAVRALEYFPTRRTEEVLMTLLYARSQRPAYQKASLRALARAFGVKVFFEVLPFLRDEESAVREGAALALGDIDDPRILGVLENHLVHEKEITVRMAIERAMVVQQTREKTRRDPLPRDE